MTYSSKTTCPDRVLPSTLHTSHCTLHSSHSKLQTSHSTLHTSHSTLLTSHCFLHTPNLTLHTSHFTLRSSHSKLKVHTPHFTLHTPHFTLLNSHCFLHTSHFTLHSLRPTLHTALNLHGTKNTNATKWRKICWQITVAAFMQPLHYDLRSRAAKDNSITNAATARSNLDAAITMWSAETELQNTIELRATASEIVAPKPDLDARAKKRRFWSTF